LECGHARAGSGATLVTVHAADPGRRAARRTPTATACGRRRRGRCCAPPLRDPLVVLPNDGPAAETRDRIDRRPTHQRGRGRGRGGAFRPVRVPPTSWSLISG